MAKKKVKIHLYGYPIGTYIPYEIAEHIGKMEIEEGGATKEEIDEWLSTAEPIKQTN